MALFEKDSRRKPGTRSNTKLVVSGGDSPAEKWVTDPSLPVLFIYDYAPPAEKEVVISKGLVVSVGPQTLDTDTNTKVNTLTIADSDATGTTAYKANPAGMAPYNFSKKYEDFLYGNQPSIITREYIELPLFTNTDDAANHKWGAAINVTGGDFVKVGGSNTGNAGQLIKWDPTTDSAHEIVGQVLATDENQEPFGWLKWAMWDESAVDQDLKGAAKGVNKEGYSGPGLEGYPFDAKYRELDQYANQGYQNPYTTDPTGIPGILDGSQKALTVQSRNFTVPAGEANRTFVFDLGLKNVVQGSFSNVTLAGAALVEGTDFTVDYTKGQLTLITAAVANVDQILAVNFRANFYGTPAGWDAKGAKGAARILLKF